MTQQVDEAIASHRSRLDLGHVLRDAEIRSAETRPDGGHRRISRRLRLRCT